LFTARPHTICNPSGVRCGSRQKASLTNRRNSGGRTPSYFVEDSWYVQVLEDGAEAARIGLDEEVGIEHCAAVSEISAEPLIELIAVPVTARGRGIGTWVLRGLAEHHPDRRLVAYSEEAHGFWASLGWKRYDHPEGRPEFHRALFMQVER
jgi:GNAT superfamily N-acetyltransferase